MSKTSKPAPVRCAIYIRVSTESQRHDQQERDVRRAVRARGWTIPATAVYKEKISGADANRPEWKRMLRDAKLRRFGAVAVWNVDRMGRDLLETHRAVELLRQRKVRLFITELNLEVEGLLGDVLIGVLAALARAERENMSRRTKMGMRGARARGVKLGRPTLRVSARDLARVRDKKISAAKLGRDLGCSAQTVLNRLAATA